jgi:hypothetical protein
VEIEKLNLHLQQVKAILAEHQAATQIDADYRAKQAQQAA